MRYEDAERRYAQIEGERDYYKRLADSRDIALIVLKKRVSELEGAIERQAKAAISGMDAAKAVASSNLEQTKRLHAEINPEALESEREANAKLTERVAELEAHVADLTAAIAECRPLCGSGVRNVAVNEAAIGRLHATAKEYSSATLNRRDLIKQAEALEALAGDSFVYDSEELKDRATELRQQAEDKK